MTLTPNQIKAFQSFVYDYYGQNQRDLPWRHTTDPYKIMVSEIMLQQTQVDRVIPKYLTWVDRFPTIDSLAEASLKEVLTYWSGLGYNRRGQSLWKAAQFLLTECGSSFNNFEKWFSLKPTIKDPLTTLPGIGPYTAAAIRAFAWNQPVIVIETNIRTVMLHHFPSAIKSKSESKIRDTQLIPLIEQTLDQSHPRDWYNALMDYGTHLKTTIGNLNNQSKSYTKQSKFTGSNRQLRGQVLKHLINSDVAIHRNELSEILRIDKSHSGKILDSLVKEGLIVRDKAGKYTV